MKKSLSKSALVLVMVLLVGIMLSTLSGCNKKETAKPSDVIEETTVVYVTETPGPITQTTPVVDEPTPSATDVIATTASPTVTGEPATTATVTPVPTTTKAPGVTTTTITQKTTPKPTAAATVNPITTAYKNVALIGPYTVTAMSPFNFSNLHGTYDQQNFFFYHEFFYLPHKVGKDKTEGLQYFTIPLTGVDLFNKDKYLEYQEKGAFPFMWNSNWPADLDVSKFPKNITKFYFDLWHFDKSDYRENGPTAEWAKKGVIPNLEEAINKVKAAFPNAKIYVGGMLPMTKSFPRTDINEWPENILRDMIKERGNETAENFEAANDAMKTWVKGKGYTFVDFYEAKVGLVTAAGDLNEDCAHYKGPGCQLSRKGLRLYADHIMETMGYPKARY
jgi:hypothetical protein